MIQTLIWISSGFALAVFCRYALHEFSDPITYGSLITCAFFSPLGFILIIPAIIWGILGYIDYAEIHAPEFWNKRVFKPKSQGGES